MQTFLPFESFQESAACLDNKRLGKQRVETLQILNALAGLSKGWVNHPATRMWRGHEQALILYGVAICNEWIKRGFKDTTLPKITAMVDYFSIDEFQNPDWLGNFEFHKSHRNMLYIKNPEYYIQFKHDDPNPTYIWPK